MEKILERIKIIVGESNLWADHASRLTYTQSANYEPETRTFPLPLAVARPVHARQLETLLAFCTEEGIPLVFRGNGCLPQSFACPLVPGALVILSTGLQRIYEVDESACTLRVQSGATCAAVQAEALNSGLFCPGLSGWQAPVTIGGILSMNEAPSDFNSFGAISSSLRVLELYTTAGKKLHCSAVSGLPTSTGFGFPPPQLFCGARGSLGFIHECVLGLLPRPQKWDSMVWLCKDEEIVMATCAQSLSGDMRRNAGIRVYDRACMEVLLPDQSSAWLVRADYIDISNERLEQLERSINEMGAVSLHRASALAGLETDCAQLLDLLYKKYGTFYYRSFTCSPGDWARFIKASQEIVRNKGYKAACWISPALARVEMAIFAAEKLLPELDHELFALELMFTQQMESEGDAGKSKAEWILEHTPVANELVQSIAAIVDPASLLAAQRSKWSCQ